MKPKQRTSWKIKSAQAGIPWAACAVWLAASASVICFAAPVPHDPMGSSSPATTFTATTGGGAPSCRLTAKAPVQVTCLERMLALYRGHEPMVRQGFEKVGDDLCKIELSLGITGVSIAAQYGKREAEHAVRLMPWVLQLRSMHFSPTEIVAILAMSGAVLSEPAAWGMTHRPRAEQRAIFQHMLATPEVARLLIYGGVHCVATGKYADPAFNIWLDQRKAKEILRVCSMSRSERMVMAASFRRFGDQTTQRTKGAARILKRIPMLKQHANDRLAAAQDLRGAAVAELLSCSPSAKRINAAAGRVAAVDTMDLKVLAGVPGSCVVFLDHGALWGRLRALSIASKNLDKRPGSKTSLSAVTTMSSFMSGAVHVLRKASKQEKSVIASLLAREPVYTLALLLDKRLTADLRRRTFKLMREHDARKIVVLLPTLSQEQKPTAAKPTAAKPTAAVAAVVTGDNALSRTIKSIEDRGLVLLDRYTVTKTGALKPNYLGAAKDMIPGYTVGRLLAAGKSPTAGDYGWVAVDVLAAVATVATLGGSAAVATAAKGGKAGSIVTKLARLAKRLSESVHLAVRAMAISGPALRAAHWAKGLGPVGRVITNPAFTTAACLGVTYGAAQLTYKTPSQAGTTHTLAHYMAGLGGGILCWRVMGTVGRGAVAAGKPVWTVRVASAVGNGISKIKIWRFNGKAAFDSFMKVFRNSPAGAGLYNWKLRQSVKDAVARAAGLGLTISIIRRTQA